MPFVHELDADNRMSPGAGPAYLRIVAGPGKLPLPKFRAGDARDFQTEGKTMNRTLALAIAATAFGLAATPAYAGQCAAPGTNPLTGAATAPKDVTDTVIGAVDLGKEINVDGRQLRLRRLVLQPGGIVPLHSHADRPALIITVSGEVTEYRSTCAEPIVHRAGEVSQEAGGLSHWWKNTGTTEAVLLSADVFHGK